MKSGATMTERIVVHDIPLKDIVISKNNARRILDPKALDELAQSIRDIGVQQPVIVFPIAGQKAKFELIVGQRRFLASQKAGKTAIPAIIKKPMDSVGALAYSFTENVHRAELDWKDKVEATLTLLKELGNIHAVAEKLSVSETTVRNYLGYAAVPEPLKEMVETGQISRPIAVRIAKANPEVEKAVAIAKLVKEAPRRKTRRAILQTNIENPTYTPEQVADEAPKLKFRHIIIDLTDKAAIALQQASEKYSMEPTEIATQALIDYLKSERFYEGT